MLYKDIITVIDQAGTTRGQTRAVVGKNKIIHAGHFPSHRRRGHDRTGPTPWQEGKTFLPNMSSSTETVGSGREFYEITTGKPDSFANRPSERGVSVYVNDSPHTRVNLNSVDSSSNVVSIQANEVFQQTRHLLETGVADSEERTILLQSVREMEAAHGTQDFITKYKDFMGLAANHMTVLNPVISALTALL